MTMGRPIPRLPTPAVFGAIAVSTAIAVWQFGVILLAARTCGGRSLSKGSSGAHSSLPGCRPSSDPYSSAWPHSRYLPANSRSANTFSRTTCNSLLSKRTWVLSIAIWLKPGQKEGHLVAA